MHSLRVSPSSSLTGVTRLPGDKSLSHRAALLAALAHGQSRIDNFLDAGVTHAMLRSLTALSIEWELQDGRLTVMGKGLGGFTTPTRALDCGNSATTLRLLAGALSAAGVGAVLDGTDSLRRRPMQRIIDPLSQMGVRVESSNGRAPLSILPNSARLSPIDYRLSVASAQVKTCILLAALAAPGVTTLREPGPSRDHTERLYRALGLEVAAWQEPDWAAITAGEPREVFVTRLSVPSSIELAPLELRLPGDISSASFLIVAGLITPGSDIRLEDVCLNPGRTGLIDALLSMGGDIQVFPQPDRHGEPVGDIRVRTSRLEGCSVSGSLVVRMIDEFPAFAVAAAFASGETLVCDAIELRHKESDRISALCRELRSLGCDAQELPDGFRIRGGRPLGGDASGAGDHRLAMALSLVGLASQKPVVVHGADIVAESFPGFVGVLSQFGASLDAV